jgi:DNA repair ATPase RecN
VRGLAAKVAIDRHHEFLTQQWDILLSDARELPNTLLQDDHVVLLDQSRRLYAAWIKFRKSLSQHQHMEEDSSQRPDIKYLIDTVSKAASTWQEDREESKSGKLKEKFFKLCENCKNHGKLLAVIPSHDKYISLLTGSLSAIAQASINHKHIAEGVVKGLDELGMDIESGIARWRSTVTLRCCVSIFRNYTWWSLKSSRISLQLGQRVAGSDS